MSTPMLSVNNGVVLVQRETLDRVDSTIHQQAQRLSELEHLVGQQNHQHEQISTELVSALHTIRELQNEVLTLSNN